MKKVCISIQGRVDRIGLSSTSYEDLEDYANGEMAFDGYDFEDVIVGWEGQLDVTAEVSLHIGETKPGLLREGSTLGGFADDANEIFFRSRVVVAAGGGGVAAFVLGRITGGCVASAASYKRQNKAKGQQERE